MKRIKKICIVILVILSIGVTSSFAATGTTKTNELRMRKAPSTNGEIITHIDKGEELEIVLTVGDWYKVKYKEFEGYVHSNYVETTGDIPTEDNTPGEQTPPEEKPADTTPEVPAPPSVIYPIEVTTVSDLKVYIVPSVTSSVITNIGTGVTITINNAIKNWSYISYQGKTGWVRNYLLENVVETAPVNDAPVVDAPVETPPATANQTPTKGYVNVAEAVMRSGPSTSSGVIAGLMQNAEVTILGEEGEWYKIEYNGTTGYMAKRLISDSQNTTSRSTTEPRQETGGVTVLKVGYVNVGTANVRKSASTSSAILFTLKQRVKVDIIGEELDFYKIQVNDEIGFIAKRLISDSLDAIAALDAPTNTTTYSSDGTETGQGIVDYAKQYLGYKYVLGGTTPSGGFDCSGFVYYVYTSNGYSLSRSLSAQSQTGTSVSKANLQLGDVLFFNNNSDGSLGHVGIYVGGGNFIHAANPSRGVVIDTINSGYYYTYYYSARRII